MSSIERWSAPAALAVGAALCAATWLVPVEHPASPPGTSREIAQRLACPTARDGKAEQLPDAEGEPAAVVQTVGAAASITPCRPGRSDGWLALVDSTDADLLLVNPDEVDAVVDLTILGPEGVITAPGSTHIAVTGKGQRVVPVSVMAPARTPVVVRVLASSGRVAAFSRVQGPKALATAASNQPERTQVVPLVDKGVSSQLVLANPTDRPVTATVVAHAARGPFTPAKGATVELPAASVQTVDLGSAFDAEAGSATITSAEPVVAWSAQSRGADVELVAAQAPQRNGWLVAPSGRLVFTNPGAAQVSVSVAGGDQQVVAAGATWTTHVDGKAPVVVSADGPVTAAWAADGDALAIEALQPDATRVDVPGLVNAPTQR